MKFVLVSVGRGEWNACRKFFQYRQSVAVVKENCSHVSGILMWSMLQVQKNCSCRGVGRWSYIKKQVCSAYVLVQYILGSDFILLCFKLIIILKHNHIQKQRKIKFKPRIKLNHNTYLHTSWLIIIWTNNSYSI
jgi:hypothetical protein